MSNRDRFWPIIEPLFRESKYCLSVGEGKYANMIIKICDRMTGECDYSIWCHNRGNRLDFVVPNWRIRQVSGDLNLENECMEVNKVDKLYDKPATAFRSINEETLIGICRHIASGNC